MTHQSTSSALLELAEKVEKATAGEQRPLIERAWDLLKPRPDVGTPDYASWGAELRRVTRLLDHGGYFDAAMLLVPEGWRRWIYYADEGRRICRIEREDEDLPELEVGSNAATWPLAITAAALRSRATGAEQ